MSSSYFYPQSKDKLFFVCAFLITEGRVREIPEPIVSPSWSEYDFIFARNHLHLVKHLTDRRAKRVLQL